MRRLEHIIKRLLNLLGFDIVKVRKVRYQLLPKPSKALTEQATANFQESFPIAPDSGLTREDVAQEVKKYLWFYPFDFGGVRVDFDARQEQAPYYKQQSHKQRHAHIFPALLSLTGGSLANHRVLDIACNAGFWSVQAKLAGAEHVLGVDASQQNVDQARFIQRVTGLKGLEYQLMNSYDLSKETIGEFDVTFFFGLLYHLDKTITAFERVYDVTKKIVVVDTRLVKLEYPILRVEADDATSYHSQSHTNDLAMIPSHGAVPLMLRSVGFREVYRIQHATENLPYPYLAGNWATFIAVK
jgi:tRNA (mo5U34)-methyltransferase